MPKQQIGDPQPGWGYQVFVMGYDSSNISRNGMFNMRVKTFPTDAFGGGTDYEEPNIIDILSPIKDLSIMFVSVPVIHIKKIIF